ncbi:MAG: hypothetical protein PHS82_05730 [Lachnospiraceae bacterium]|nr:hypothetical protein [Lachnospiraceae bacterium]
MKKKSHIGLNIAITLLSISFAVLLLIGIAMFRSNSYSRSPAKEESMYYYVRSHDFFELVNHVDSNNSLGYQPTDNEKEYYALADCYENAFRYKMYLDNGEKDKAAACLQVVQDAEEQTGILSSEVDYIKELFGIQAAA